MYDKNKIRSDFFFKWGNFTWIVRRNFGSDLSHCIQKVSQRRIRGPWSARCPVFPSGNMFHFDQPDSPAWIVGWGEVVHVTSHDGVVFRWLTFLSQLEVSPQYLEIDSHVSPQQRLGHTKRRDNNLPDM